ncbi:MAG TPA: protein kinase [Candidatus Solibacter sp.]|nr:protein kinase [Candidatus Solibacter sp.]
MIGQTIGHYLILEQIGAGGMGVVYRARDERLNRDVALKVLPPGKLGDDAPRKRFRKEALALAKLNHPNIGTVYDFDSQDDVDFLVMEFIPGETLDRRLAKGTLPEKDWLSISLQIAAALEEAHEHGIVHQDLKPGNIIVTPKGQVKVVDFGLARLLDADSGGGVAATLTQTDGAGTLPYMAPEQLRGDAVDSRTDIFAAGAVLYEMCTGQRPFRELQPARLIQQILNEAPRPPGKLNPRSSPQVESVILKALDKQPELRYQSARELRVDLERLAAQQAASTAVPAVISATRRGWKHAVRRHSRPIYFSAAVLAVAAAAAWWLIGARPVLSFAPRDWLLITDFDNQTGEPLFDRSLQTALTVSLEQSSHANVVPRARIAEALRRMGKSRNEKITEDLGREISQREAIRAILSCSITSVGKKYALTARLIDPQTGMAVRSYLEEAKNQDSVLDALGSIATHVRRDLGESMLATRKADRPLPMVTTRSLQALKLFADGGVLWSKGQWEPAVQAFESAVKTDPDFAMAHAALGGAYYSHIFNSPARGKLHNDKALELSEHTTDRERLYIQTRYAQDLGHVAEARNRFEVYLQTYPDDWGMRANYASLLRNNGQPQEALEQYKELVRIAPNNASSYIDLATCYNILGNFAESVRTYEQAFKLEPSWETNQNINHEYGMAIFRMGDEAKARQTFELALDKPDLRAKGQRSLAWLDLYHGKYAVAKSLLQEALLSDENYKWALSILREHNLLAIVADGQGDRAGRLRQLDLAVPFLSKIGPQIRPALWLGTQYARSGSVAKAADILEKIRPLADPQNPEQLSDLQTLEAEVEFARGNKDHAIELLLLADKAMRTSMTLEGLAHAYEASGKPDQAAGWYEFLLGQVESPLGWEPQQDWIAAHYHLARIYFSQGDKAKAAADLDWFLDAWKDADPALPLLKDALQLKQQLDGKP